MHLLAASSHPGIRRVPRAAQRRRDRALRPGPADGAAVFQPASLGRSPCDGRISLSHDADRDRSIRTRCAASRRRFAICSNHCLAPPLTIGSLALFVEQEIGRADARPLAAPARQDFGAPQRAQTRYRSGRQRRRRRSARLQALCPPLSRMVASLMATAANRLHRRRFCLATIRSAVIPFRKIRRVI